MNIDGYTQLLGLLGNPVKHTLSPVIHNSLSEILNINEVYVPFCVDRNDLQSVVKGAYGLGILGLNVTVPYKNDVISYLVDVDEAALQIGAVNTLVKVEGGYKGYNTDMLGLYREIINEGIDLNGEQVIVIGAGGASKAVVYMCAKYGAKKVYLLNRTIEKAIDISENINSHFCKDIVTPMEIDDYNLIPKNKYLVFQTTSCGLHPNVDSSPIENVDFYNYVHTAVDIIYRPEETKFMRLSKSAGAKVYNGLKMLLYQGVIAYELWNNVSIDEDTCETILCQMIGVIKNNDR